MTGVVVRVASAADLLELPAVEAAADELFRARGVLDLPAPAPAAVRAQAWRVLVAGRPVQGFAVLERVDGDVHLEQLSVQPSAMRRGIGAALLEAAVSEARVAGARRVTLLTYADVPWNGPWYARHGWRGTDDLGPELQALAAHEAELGLTRHGRRVAMARPVDDAISGSVYQAGRVRHPGVQEPPR
ncbi:GNAT family N-acetyltransferase [Geodermatophilus sp. URMC 61]|uniref:GNAT family N-acetyltransferase n=1 Tax=Geodermatophilus sp. URMC 61 TaxID=3423411 RepID=UPI00406C776F